MSNLSFPERTQGAPPLASERPWTSSSSILNSAIPGSPGLTSSATNIVKQLLTGLPGTSASRRDAAFAGVRTGIPGSELTNKWRYDLYNKDADEREQRGIQDLLAMISGYTGPALQERGQNIQQDQFGKSLQQQQAEFAAKLAQQQQQINLELDKFGFNKDRYLNELTAPQKPRNVAPHFKTGELYGFADDGGSTRF